MQDQLRLVADGETPPVPPARHPSWCEQGHDCTREDDTLSRDHLGIAEQFVLLDCSHGVITLRPGRWDRDGEIGTPYVNLTVRDLNLIVRNDDSAVDVDLTAAELEMLIMAAQRQLRLLGDQLGDDVFGRDEPHVPEGKHCTAGDHR
jgi:hypothetical protein